MLWTAPSEKDTAIAALELKAESNTPAQINHH